MRELPTIEMLHRLLICDADAGKLFWRARTADLFNEGRQSRERACKAWNTCWAGKEAFTARMRSGHLVGAVFAQNMLKHRVIWAMTHGEWPSDQIDHINGAPSDNRLANLRPATQAQNKANAGKRPGRNGTSRYIGVCWSAHENKWVAQVGAGGKPHRAGSFRCETRAALARDALARRLHGEFARLNFPQVAA